jgi:hypothetical protein
MQHLRQSAGIIVRIGWDLGEGNIACGLDKLPEIGICHGTLVHPEPVHSHTMLRSLFGVVLVRSHLKGAPGNP